MADKSFGVKQINLIGASGTPTIESPNNLNLNATTVAISTDVTIGGEVQSNLKVGSLYSVGIGTTNPTSKLHVVGDIRTTGVITAASFSGNASSATSAGVSTSVIGGIGSVTQLSVSGVTTLGTVQISSGIVTATSGVVTYYGSGVNLTGIVTNIANGGGITASVSNGQASLVVNSLGSSIEQLGILTHPPAYSSRIYFGYTVASDYDASTILVTDFSTDSNRHIYIFDKSASGYDFVGVATETYGFTQFPGSDSVMSDDGTIFAVSRRESSVSNSNQIVIWQRTGNTFSGIATITQASVGDGTGLEGFGASFDMSSDGTKFVIGSGSNQVAGIGSTDYGTAYVIDRSGSTVTGIATLVGTASTQSSTSAFGVVAMSDNGSTILVGDPVGIHTVNGVDYGGIVYKFTRTGNTVTQVGIITGSRFSTTDRFGGGVEISGDGSRIFVADPNSNVVGAASSSGIVYVYDSNLNEIQQISPHPNTTTGGNNILGLGYLFRSGGINIAYGKLLQSSYDGKVLVIGDSEISNYYIYVYDTNLNRYTLNKEIDFSSVLGSSWSVAVSGDGTRSFIPDINYLPSGGSAKGALYYYQNNASNLLQSAGNNIGIGTTTPTSKLHVIGNVDVSGIITATRFYGDGSSLNGSPSPNTMVISGDTTLSVNDTNKLIIGTTDSCVVTLPPIQDGLIFNFVSTGYNIGIKTETKYIHGRKSLTKVSIGTSDSSGLTLYSYNNKWHVLNGSAPLHVQSRSFSSGTTYTPTPGTIAFLACVTGGGGGSDGNTNTNKGGGGGGGYAEKLYLPPLQTSYSMSIPAAVTSSGVLGFNGGDTTFGDVSVGIITATGGTKGTSSGGGTGGVGQGGDFNANGGNGGAGTNNGGGGGGAAGSRFGNGGNGGDGTSTVSGGGGNLGGNSGIGSTGGSDPTSLAVGIYNLGGGLGPANGGSFTLPTVSLDGLVNHSPNSRGGKNSAYDETEGDTIPSNLSLTFGGGGAGRGGNAYSYPIGSNSSAGNITIVEIFAL